MKAAPTVWVEVGPREAGQPTQLSYGVGDESRTKSIPPLPPAAEADPSPEPTSPPAPRSDPNATPSAPEPSPPQVQEQPAGDLKPTMPQA